MRKLTKASYGRTPDDFHQAVTSALALPETKGSPARRRQIRTVLIAAILLIALACTAVAALYLRRSPQNLAVIRAREAMQSTYGIERASLVAFSERLWQTEDGWQVDYEPFMLEDRLGRYHVAVPRDGTAEAFWFYREVDLQALAEAGMASEIWGAAQLREYVALQQAYYDKQAEMRERLGPDYAWSLQDRAALDAMLLDVPYMEGKQRLCILPGPEDIQEADAVALARETVLARWGIAETALDAYTRSVVFLQGLGGDSECYVIQYTDTSVTQYMDGMGIISVVIDSPSGEIRDCDWSVWPKNRTLPEGPLDAYADAVQAYVESGAFALITDETKREDIAGRINAAGFGEWIGNETYLPQTESALTREQAVQAARTALGETYGLTGEMLGLFTESAAYLLVDGEDPAWRIRFTPSDRFDWDMVFAEKLGEYTVELSEEGGRPWVDWSLDGAQDDREYTEETWGSAPAWDAQILPWLLALEEDLAVILEQEASTPQVGGTGIAGATYVGQPRRDSLLRAAGFDAFLFDAALPDAQEVSWASAVALTAGILREEYGMPDDALEGYRITGTLTMMYESGPIWRMTVMPDVQDAVEAYSIKIDGRSGDVLESNYVFGVY